MLAGGESGVRVVEGVADESISDDVDDAGRIVLVSEDSAGPDDVGLRLESSVVGVEKVGAVSVALSLVLVLEGRT